MTKAEYMQALQEQLERFSKELQEEILEDYMQHFAEGEQQGRTEEEIIAELGNIEEMIQDLPETDEVKGESAQGQSEPVQEGGSYSGEYRAVVLECEVADIVLEPSDDGKIYAEYHNDLDDNNREKKEFSFYQREENGVFYAGVKGPGKQVSFFGKTIHMHADFKWNARKFKWNGSRSMKYSAVSLMVKIPRGMQKISFITDSGDVTIRGIQAGVLEGGTASGDLKIGSSAADRLLLNTTSGDLVIDSVSTAFAELNTVSGDMESRRFDAGQVFCNATSGDMDIETEAIKCRCNTVSGDIRLCLGSVAGETDLNTVSGDIELHLKNAGGMLVEANTTSGDVEISWEGTRMQAGSNCSRKFGDGSYRVDVNTVSGDVEIRK